jgi:hypothetical protein
LIMRGGAVVARWAHNPKVIGSNPIPATINRASVKIVVSFTLALNFFLIYGRA